MARIVGLLEDQKPYSCQCNNTLMLINIYLGKDGMKVIASYQVFSQ